MMVIGQPCRLKKINNELNITIGNSVVDAIPSVRNIGAYIDCELLMNDQISNICRASYMSLRSLRKIRPYLTPNSAETLVHAFVTCRLDNLNSLLVGLPDYQIQRLQLIQNNAARIITRTPKYDSITCVLIALHWLPVKARIDFKVLLLTYKALNGLSPSYIEELVTLKVHPRNTRLSADKLHLDTPRMRLKTVGDRAFSAYAPVVWNTLPLSVRERCSLDSFKRGLKKHLFKQYYPDSVRDI